MPIKRLKLVISGGQNYELTKKDKDFIIDLNSVFQIMELIPGGSKRINISVEKFAKQYNFKIKRIIIDNKLFGNSAPYIKNLKMAEYGNSVILFPGSHITNNMYKCAIKHNLKIYDKRNL